MKGETATLKELVTYTRDGEWGSANPDDGHVPMRVIRGTDFESVRHGSLEALPTRYIRADIAARKTLQPWDVLIETAGGSKDRPTGRTLLVRPHVLASSRIPVTCASFARFLRIDDERAHPAYIYWFLQYLYFIGEMEQHQVQHTGVARFQFTRFSETVEIPLPPPPLQRAIALILGTLDDKIELNRRMNETLEAMARALFKSWFVDFDPVRAKMEGRWRSGQSLPGLPAQIYDLFPNRLVPFELGEIPQGWEVGKLEDFAALNPENWSKHTRPDKIRYVDLSNTKWGRIESVTLYSRGDAPSRAQRVLRPRDTILGTVRPGNGSYSFISEKGLTGSTGFAVLRPRSISYAEFVYLAATTKDNIESLSHLADGAAYPAVRPAVVASTPVVQPDDSVLNLFSSSVGVFLDRMAACECESRTLTALRDTLLPKLISGEIRLKDAETIVGRAS